MPLLKIGPYAGALDLPEFERGGATEAKNVIPRVDSYGPLPSFQAQGNAMASRVMGAAISRGIAGSIAQFAGTGPKLYKWDVSGLNWTEVTRVSGDYATPAEGHVSFAQFGDFIVSVNGFDAPQVFTIGSSTNFDALAGSPPVARHVAASRDFVLLGNISGFKNRVAWSGFNNITAWTQSQITQSDFQDLPDGGSVMGLIGGEYIVVLQERNIQRGIYVNLPLVWQFDKIAQGIGTPCERAHARYEDMIFFLSDDGFEMLIGGQQLRDIGHNKVDKTFWNDVDQSKLHRVTAAVDPINKLVVWSYVSRTSADGEPDKLLIYAWMADRWSRAEVSMEMLHSAVSQAGFTLDQLDVFGTLDSLPFSLDSAFWVGAGRPLLAGFTTAHKIGFFNGAYMAATVDTMEAEPSPGHRSQINHVRPMIEGSASPTVKIGHRTNLTDDVTFTPASAVNSFGVCPVLVNDRYMRARIDIPAASSFRHILGIDTPKALRRSKW